jgi:hypothetical protein
MGKLMEKSSIVLRYKIRGANEEMTGQRRTYLYLISFLAESDRIIALAWNQG